MRITGALQRLLRAFIRCTGGDLGRDIGGDPIAPLASRAQRDGWSYRELLAPHAMSLPSVSRHLRVLERAGLIVKGRSAQWRPCRLNAAPLAAADAWMAPYRAFFEERLTRLEQQLANERKQEDS